MDYRTALITGASSGLGHALALHFARSGVRVYAAARRLDKLEQLAASVPGLIHPVALDVGRPESKAQIEQLDRETGGLDLVVANAGIGGDTHARRIDWARVEQIIDINVTGAARTLCAALPGMVERGRGHLVGISSVGSFRGLPRHGAYCASKAFLATFLESLRVDLRGTGVRVTCLHPGFVKSELTAKNRFKMPFLLETADAAEKMGRAIRRGARSHTFPWQMAALSGPLRLLPNALYDVLGPRLK